MARSINANSKRQQAIAIFNSALPQREALGSTAFRKQVLAEIEAKTGASRASAASMYNTAKKMAVEAGDTVDFARSGGEEIKREKLDELVAVVRVSDNEVVTNVERREAKELVARAKTPMFIV